MSFSLPAVRRFGRKRSNTLSEAPALQPSPVENINAPEPQLTDQARRSVCIIGADNGMGLSRDRDILVAAFRDAGWDVSLATSDKHGNEQHTVNLHLETVAQRFLRTAPVNVIVPNPEWWSMDWNPILRQPSIRVWAKTEDAARIFKSLGAQVQHIGFRSMDRRDVGVPRQRAFLHVGGKSPNKGTSLLVSCWRSEWPQLIVVTSQPVRSVLPNVTIVRRRTSDTELRRLQNECQFHIYPSAYEGFGHAQWEGLSCGAVVFATNGPPFSEHGDAFRLLDARPTKNGFVSKSGVLPTSIAAALKWANGLTQEAIAECATHSRNAWEQNTTAFAAAIDAAIAEIEGPRLSLEPVAAPRITTELPVFNYVGRVDCVTGQGTAARHQLHVLRKRGLRFRVVDAGSCASPDPKCADPFVQTARKSDSDVKPGGTIIHLQPNTAERFHHDPSLPRPHILVSVWETSKLPAAWIPLINSYDQVWCATWWQYQVYRDSGIKESLLRLVPFAIDPSLYPAQPRGRISDGKTVFGSVFQWTERKDPQGLIGAFLHAFTADDRVVLVLKSYEGDNPTTSVNAKVDAIVKSFQLPGKPPEIRAVSSALDGQGMADFYRSIDCCVSSHRGEGFGFQIAESLLYGRPVIATGWSAPAEYADGCFRAVRYTLEPPHRNEWQPFYTADQLWARIDVSDLAQSMREAHQKHITLPLDLFRERCSSLVERAGDAAYESLREIVK